jgi:thymidylate synthase
VFFILPDQSVHIKKGNAHEKNERQIPQVYLRTGEDRTENPGLGEKRFGIDQIQKTIENKENEPGYDQPAGSSGNQRDYVFPLNRDQ